MKRQAEEQAELSMEDTVEMLLLRGETGYSIIQQGIAPSHIVNRVVAELRPELEEIRKNQEKALAEVAQNLHDAGESMREISKQTGKSYNWLKTRIRI